jgi:hypothetical protein
LIDGTWIIEQPLRPLAMNEIVIKGQSLPNQMLISGQQKSQINRKNNIGSARRSSHFKTTQQKLNLKERLQDSTL